MILNSSNNKYLYGHEDVFNKLRNLYLQNKLPNKIIFSGNKGIGKATLAYHLTNFIFSIDEVDKYDFKNNKIIENNHSYKLVSNNSHPNFFVVTNDNDKASNIQISKIRDMINFTNKSSFNNGCKIILIDNVEFLNTYSINALLKVIEEPNSKIFFFLIHNSKSKILNTLMSRCIRFNLYLNQEKCLKTINKLLDNDFYSNLNEDFKNIYTSPGDILLINKFFIDNKINESISIDDFLYLLIDKSLFKKDLYIKENINFFIELYFKKKFDNNRSKIIIYNLYKYFLNKLSSCKKYNLDLESILLEFKNRTLNG